MSEFFKGWRRKAGCVLLVMASTLFIIWMRSYSIEDNFDMGSWVATSGNGYASFFQFGGNSPLISSWRSYNIPAGQTINHHPLAIPYWLATLPLTLLSAYLIVRPGKRKAAQPTQSST